MFGKRSLRKEGQRCSVKVSSAASVEESLQRPSNTPHSTRRYKNMDILTSGRRVRMGWGGREGISGMGIWEHPQHVKHGCHVVGVEIPHQEFAFLFPVVALGVRGHVGFCDHADQLPLLLRGLRAVPRRLLKLLAPPPLAILLDQLPFGQTLAVVQHHCRKTNVCRI